MASRKKPQSPAIQELVRLQRIGAEAMEQSFNNWVRENHVHLVGLVLARAADERETVADAAYGIFLDCLRTQQHQTQVNLGHEIDSEGDVDQEEAA